MRKTNQSLDTINFRKDYFLSLIRKLYPNKVHGHDQIVTNRLLQICEKAICKLLHLIFFPV